MNLNKMSVYEFVTVAKFFMQPDYLCSKPLLAGLLHKIQDSVQEFNELQLIIL